MGVVTQLGTLVPISFGEPGCKLPTKSKTGPATSTAHHSWPGPHTPTQDPSARFSVNIEGMGS